MMVSREEKKYLLDVKEAILSIDDHLEHRRDFEEYLSNKTKRRAVEREMEIIGEAVGKLLKLNNDIAISYKKVIINLRNRITHAYDSIDHEIIWKIITKDIPILLSEVVELLEQ